MSCRLIIARVQRAVLAILLCQLMVTPQCFAQVNPSGDLPEGALRSFGDAQLADTSGVQILRFSPDGKSFVTCNRELDVWDSKTGLLQKQISRPKLNFLNCWFESNGKLLVFAQNFQVMPVLMVINSSTDKDEAYCELPKERAGWVPTQSLESHRIIFGGRSISLIDATNGSKIADPGARLLMSQGGSMTTPQAAFTTDGKQILFIDTTGHAVMIDGLTGKPVDGATPINAPQGAVMLSDQKTIAVAGTPIKLYDWHTGKLTGTLPADPGPKNMEVGGLPPIKCISASPSAGMLAAITTDIPARVLLWNTAQHPIPSPKVISTVQPLQGGPSFPAISWNADGSLLAVCGEPGRIQVLDVRSMKFIYPAPQSQGIDAMCVSPDGQSVIEADQTGLITKWDIDAGTMQTSRRLAGPDFGRFIKILQANPQDGSIVTATENGNVEILDPKTLETRKLIHGDPGVTVASLSHNGQLIAQKSDKVVRVWNLSTGASLYRINEPDQTQWDHFAISPAHDALVVADREGMQAYDLKTGKPGVLSAWPENFGISSVDFEPMGPWLLASGFYGVVGYPADHLLGDAVRKPAWDIRLQSTSEVSSSNTGSLVAAIGFLFQGEERGYGKPQAILLEPGHSEFACSFNPIAGSIDSIRFVPHRPLMVTTSKNGITTVWDLRLLLDVPKDKNLSDSELFDDMKADVSPRALRAGLALLERRKVTQFSPMCKPLSTAPANPPDIAQLITQLSAPEKAIREKAHKQLEGLGPAAIDQVQRALSAHPGGELEGRLSDIARVIGANDLNQPAKDAASGTPPPQDSEQNRTLRMIQLLDWTSEPAATAEMKRLAGK